jgi:hypothetical protein
MRPLSILTAALLLTAALAAVAAPGAAQEVPRDPFPEPEPCPHSDWFNKGHVRITQRGDCNLDIVLFEDIICVGGWGSKVEQTVAGQRVIVYYCTGGIQIDPDFIAITTSAPSCKPLTEEVTADTTHRVEVFSDCTARITLNEGVICLGGSVKRTEQTLGPVTLVSYGCGSPDPTFPPDIWVTTAGCGEKALAPSNHVRIVQHADCSHDVFLFEGLVCVGDWGGAIETEVAGQHVTAYYCDGGLGDRIRDLIEPAATTSAVPCRPSPDMGIPGTVTVRIDYYCNATVTVNEGVHCLGGSVIKKQQTVGPVTLVVYSCGHPDPTFPPSIASQAAPCPALQGSTAAVAFDIRSGCAADVGVVDGARVCGFNGMGWQTESVQVGVATLYRFQDCSVRLDIKLYECIWNCYWQTLVAAGPLEVRMYSQGQPPAQASSAAVQPDWCKVRDTTPQPLQGQWSQDAAGCYKYVEPWQCLGGSGSSIERRVGPVKTNIMVCSPPPGSLPDLQ